MLQQLLALPTPRYLHTPLVLNDAGEKLSKQSGAQALNAAEPIVALRAAAGVLRLPPPPAGTRSPGPWLAEAVAAWQAQWPRVP
jgi:glutamyl-Q tRNA(Asp) synthetase